MTPIYVMSTSRSAKHSYDETDSDMAASSARTPKRSKATELVSRQPVSNRSDDGTIHRYLRDQDVAAIERWKQDIPTKRSSNKRGDADPVVEAYIQAKLALFQNATVQPKRSDSAISLSTTT